MAMKCARKNKNKWFMDALGLMIFFISRCMPYPAAITKIKIIKTVSFCTDCFLFHAKYQRLAKPLRSCLKNYCLQLIIYSRLICESGEIIFPNQFIISLAFAKAAAVGFSPLSICAITVMRSSLFNKRIEVTILSLIISL